ncbi:MAG: NAD(P)-dependent oxidoreductase [Nitrososphaera sp.]
MIVGVPKEIKDYENRVSLVPRSISSLTNAGIRVIVEAGAGARSGFSDDEYSAAGATVVRTASELYSGADLIVKVKEIQTARDEAKMLKPSHVVFGFNHFESSKELTDVAVRSKATFISFEKIVDVNGQTPILMPMSRIAGSMAGLWGGFLHNYSFRHAKSIRLKTGADETRNRFVKEFERILDGNIDDDLKVKLSLQDKSVVIFGGGTVGEAAAKITAALGCKLTIIEKRDSRRKYLEELRFPRLSVNQAADFDTLRGSTVIIGATYDRDKADRMISEKLLKEISEVRKKIIIDVSIDQGGNFPYYDMDGKYSPSAMSSILNPALIDQLGNIFVRVPNIPSIVPQYASSALSSVVSRYVIDLARGNEPGELHTAISIKAGKILDESITKAHSL